MAARILVIDDNLPLLKLVCSYLHRDRGYEVIAASGPGQAIEIMKDQQFDLLISDVEMPGMSGQELLRVIRQISPGIPCILMSGGNIVPESLPRDVPLIRKPFERNDLISAIEKVLGQAQDEQ